MTHLQAHNCSRNLNQVLHRVFKHQLLSISPLATLCYQGHYYNFTISLFESNSPTNKLVSIPLGTKHLTLLSDYPSSPEVEQLVQDLTRFIMNEVDYDNITNPIT